jgi:nicotinamidase-related amidase
MRGGTVEALLVIDVQCGMFTHPTAQPHDGEGVVSRIVRLVGTARSSGAPVIFVQHAGRADELLAPHKPGFALHPALAPREDEPVVVKRYCNAFQDTDLADRLKALGVTKVTICGLQTEYCVDTACRAAFADGLKVTLAQDAHTTFDTAVMPAKAIVSHHNTTLGAGFVTLKAADEIRFRD